MKQFILRVAFFTLALCIIPMGIHADDSGADLFGAILDTALGGGGLSNDTIVQGLLEASKVGTGNAVTSVSLEDGYLGNNLIKIPLPDDVQQAESLIRLAGFGDKLDEFVVSMNRAAEKAAPEAKELFMGAIKEITFSDARRILEGRDNEATLYFKDKTEDKLFKVFQPIVNEALNDVGVTKDYKELEGIINTLPIKGAGDFQLEKYVTDKALDGLFTVVAQEEKKIRENPEARVNDILKKVFGN